MKKYIYNLLVALFVLGMGSCSTDSETLTSSISQDSKMNYRFVVNVTKDNTRANEKTGWEKDDVISGYVDGYTRVNLTYQGDDYWDVNVRASDVEKDTCKIHAFYGNSADEYLYTDEGKFMRSNGTIFINLNMNKRPNAKITVKGVDEGYRVANLNTVNTFRSTWDFFDADTLKNVEPAEYDKQTQTAVFYGVVVPTNKKTKVLLYNADGVGYSRVYNKVMKGGESIVLNGPNSSEANLWTKYTLAKNITLNESRITTYLDETHDLKATIEPVDADNGELVWTSSNTDVATVDNDGHVKIVGVGESLITVSTKDGTRNTCCAITSGYHAYITFSNVASSQGNGILDAYFVRYIYNEPMYIKYIYMHDNSTGKEYLLYTVPEERQNEEKFNATLKFSNLPTGYYCLKAVYEYKGREYTVYSGNTMNVK